MSPTEGQMNTFVNGVKSEFDFLLEMNFRVVESQPTLVRYRNKNLEVSIYQGRQSFEVGFEITFGDTMYSLEEFIRVLDPEFSKNFSLQATSHADKLAPILSNLSALVKRYCANSLRGDPDLFQKIDGCRKIWRKEFALDVLESQVRPKAESAFREKDFASAASLYASISARLSPAEVKKMEFAKTRSSRKDSEK